MPREAHCLAVRLGQGQGWEVASFDLVADIATLDCFPSHSPSLDLTKQDMMEIGVLRPLSVLLSAGIVHNGAQQGLDVLTSHAADG